MPCTLYFEYFVIINHGSLTLRKRLIKANFKFVTTYFCVAPTEHQVGHFDFLVLWKIRPELISKTLIYQFSKFDF